MLRVRDLPESTLHSGQFLYCSTCGARYSATRGDYFWMPPNEILGCEEDSTPFILARESVRIVPEH